jgi:glycosyltransferase involved in cell wall biosynthesis
MASAMKLIIQIPCYNEAETLPRALAALPRDVPGFDEVQWLIIDDGSTDATSAIAREHGVDHIIRHKMNLGLARAFMSGLDECVRLGADVIVNTDADNQYDARDIPKLIEPILSSRAELVVGARPIEQIAHFSPVKKVLQRLGSAVVRMVSRTDIPDAPSGFRAISRRAAMQLNVFNSYTYTLETIIQAGHKGIPVTSVPIRTNAELRPSRLVRSIPSYVRRSIVTIVRIFMTYKPAPFFGIPGLISFVLGSVLGLRFLAFYIAGEGEGHIQSVILAALLMGSGFFLVIVGLMADLISVNRKLLEKIDWKIALLDEAVRRPKRTRRASADDAEEPASAPEVTTRPVPVGRSAAGMRES